jgi:hypothetical protein
MNEFAYVIELDAILDRTTRGRQKILQKGQWIGGGTVKYGYVFNRENRSRTANPDTAPIVRRIFAEVASGISLSQVAETLTRQEMPTPFAYAGRAGASTIWWPTTIRQIIREKTYIGEVAARRYAADGPRLANGHRKVRLRPVEEHLNLTDARTEPLVSAELFARANTMMARLRTKKGRPLRDRSMLLSGMIYCGLCGSRMTPQKMRNRHRTKDGYGRPYEVKVYRCFAPRLKNGPDCGRTCSSGWVEELAWSVVVQKILTPGFLERELKKVARDDGGDRLRSDLKAAEERRRKIDKQVKQLVDARLEADSKLLASAIKDKLKDLDRMADDIDRHVADLRSRIEALGQRRRLIDGFLGIIGQIRQRARDGLLDREEKRDIFEMLGARAFAWRDGEQRRIRVELPFGAACGNLDKTTGCST